MTADLQSKVVVQVPSTTTGTKSIPSFVSLIAGGIAGAVEASVTYPLEFVKTRAQLQSHQRSVGIPKNPLVLVYRVAKYEGLSAVYTGCSTLIIGTAAKGAVRFMTFDSIRNALSDNNGMLSTSRGILAGMIAGTVESLLVVTPTERIKTALIDDAEKGGGAKKFHSGMQAVRYLINQPSGPKELYRGALSTTLKQCATSGVRMGSYNLLKEQAKAHEKILPRNNAITTFCLGAVAGTITVYATQPFDVVKTRSQSVQGMRFGEAMRSIWADYGVRGFWKGSTMRLGRLVLSGGIVFSVYEQVAHFLMGGRR